MGLLLEIREDSHTRVFVREMGNAGGFSNLKPCLFPLQLAAYSLYTPQSKDSSVNVPLCNN